MRKINLVRAGMVTVAVLMSFGGVSWAHFNWDLIGSLSTGYDDNITYVKTDKISDMVTQASLGGGFNQEGKTYAINFHAGVTQNIFTQHSSFNNFSEHMVLDAHKDLTQYDHLTAHETFTHSEDPRSFEDAFGRASGRYGSYLNRFNLGYAREITSQWTTKLKYSQSNDIFSREDLSDSVAYVPGVETDYEINSKTKLLLGYDYTRRFFDPGTDASDHRVSYGLRRYLTSLWYVDLKSGMDFINAFDGSDLQEPHYEFGLTHELDENTKLNVAYIKEYSISPFSQDIFNNWRWRVSGIKELTARLKATIVGFYGKGEYLTGNIIDKLSGADLGLEYALSDRADLSLTYRHERTESNFDSREYAKNIVLFGIKFNF